MTKMLHLGTLYVHLGTHLPQLRSIPYTIVNSSEDNRKG